MAKDFFDSDLIEARSARSAPPPAPAEAAPSDELPSRTISDLNLTRMAKYREQRLTQQAESAKELETNRRKSDEIERERRQYEEEIRAADRFEQGRREVLDKLDQTLVMLEKYEMQAQRLAELYAGTRSRFKELQQEVKAIHESEWNESAFRDELNRALVVIEEVRKEYGKSMARLEAAQSGGSGAEASGSMTPALAPEEPKGFSHWVRTGFAFFLPLMAFILVLAVLAAVAAALSSR